MANNKPLAEAEAEKLLVSYILTHVGHLLIAKSPIKSKAKDEAEKYRGQLLTGMSSEERQPFLQTREILVEMAQLLASSQDREKLGKVLTYFQKLNKGEIFVAVEPDDEAIKQKLKSYFTSFAAKKIKCRYTDSELDEIIKIVQNVESQEEFEAENLEEQPA